MKKKLTLLLTILLAACLLTGCVQSDVNLKLGMRGNVTVDMTALFDTATMQQLITTGQDVSTFFDETIKGNLEADASMPDDNEGVVMEKVEQDNMCGVHMQVKYKDWEQCMKSAYFSTFVGPVIPSAGVYLADKGVTYEKETGMLGSTYHISGGFTMDDLVSINGTGVVDAPKGAKVSFKISAPLFTAKSNAAGSSIFKTTHVWEMTDGGEMNIDFTAFIPNFAVLLESIAILILLIAVIVLAIILAGKSKKEESEEEIEGQISMEDELMLDTEAENFFGDEEVEAEEGTEEVAEVAEEIAEEVTEAEAEEETTEE